MLPSDCRVMTSFSDETVTVPICTRITGDLTDIRAEFEDTDIAWNTPHMCRTQLCHGHQGSRSPVVLGVILSAVSFCRQLVAPSKSLCPNVLNDTLRCLIGQVKWSE